MGNVAHLLNPHIRERVTAVERHQQMGRIAHLTGLQPLGTTCVDAPVLRRGSHDGLPTYVGRTGGSPASVTTDPALADKLPVAPARVSGKTRCEELMNPQSPVNGKNDVSIAFESLTL